MAQPITQLTLIILTLAALVFVSQVARQKRAGQQAAWSFSTFLLVVLIGWMATEVVSDAAGVAQGELIRVTHFAVMMLVAATITLQLRRSFGK